MITKKEVYMIIVFALLASFLSIVASGFIFKTRMLSTKVEVVESISSDFPAPDKAYFNDKALNPTQMIKIGDINPSPFTSSSEGGQ